MAVHMYYLKDIFQKRIVVFNVAVVSLQSDLGMVMSNSKATDDPFRVFLRGKQLGGNESPCSGASTSRH